MPGATPEKGKRQLQRTTTESCVFHFVSAGPKPETPTIIPPPPLARMQPQRRGRGRPRKKRRVMQKSRSRSPNPGPSHSLNHITRPSDNTDHPSDEVAHPHPLDDGAEVVNIGEEPDTGDPSLRDLHAGMKPSRSDGCALDREPVELEDKFLYGGTIKVKGPMANMKVNPDDEWLPLKERRKLDSRKKGKIIHPSQEIKDTHWCQGKRKAHSHGPDVAAKSERSQRRPQHVRAMKNQTKLTNFKFLVTSSHRSTSPSTSAPSSQALSVDASRVSSVGPSGVLSVAPSPVPSPLGNSGSWHSSTSTRGC